MLETPASQSQSHSQSESQYAKYASQYEVTTVICPICGAVYAPSPSLVSFLQASPDALESAFMSMCHFCFRCRRPACPQCWDGVHGVCGDCVHEAHLSFRSEAAPLEGLIFRPFRREERSQEEVAAALLACVKPGRFQQGVVQANAAPADMTRRTEGRIPARLPELREEAEDVQGKETIVVSLPNVPQRVTEKVTIAQVEKVDEEEDEVENTAYRSHPVARVFGVIERILTVLALVLLLIIIALVVIAQSSATANTVILQVLHIDIRAEVAYLVHLVQQLRQ
jgi:hypothetical protein